MPGISQQAIGTEARHIQIDPAVVVIVSCGDTHSIVAIGESGCSRDVGKVGMPLAVRSDLQIIAIKWVTRSIDVTWQRIRLQTTSLHQKDIQIAIAIVIEQSTPRTEHFGHISYAGHAIVVAKQQARFVGGIVKRCRLFQDCRCRAVGVR